MSSEFICRTFDQDNPNWNRDDTYSRLFIKGVRNHLNNVLVSRGHVLLNDAYDALGMTRTMRGCIDGWINEEVRFVDIDIIQELPNGALILKFNPQSEIWDLIEDSYPKKQEAKSISEVRADTLWGRETRRVTDIAMAKRFKSRGFSNKAAAEIMGLTESSFRHLLNSSND